MTLGDPYSNVAFEEALLRGAKVPTLRIWENQKSVVIGRGQLAGYETNVEYCRAHSIPIVRRVTAGGAVYNGPGNLNWTFLVRNEARQGFRATLDAKGVFEEFASRVVSALESCGIDARFVPPNSIADGKGKVCGMAAFISKEATICHGTLLVSADLGLVRELTRPGSVEAPRRYQRSRFKEVSNCGVDQARFVRALASSDGGFIEGNSTVEEEGAMTELLAKYRSDSWNLGDPFA